MKHLFSIWIALLVVALVGATHVVANDENDGISGVSTVGGGYKAEGQVKFIVHVESSPMGAKFNVDDSTNAACQQTPCDIVLVPGNHRFTFSADSSLDLDTLFDVRGNGQTLSVKLVSSFGVLLLEPTFVGGMGNIAEAEIIVDGDTVHGKELRLSVGEHQVQISHRCYETVSFTANMNVGSKVSFDQKISPLMGGLEMDVLLDGKPVIRSLYANGEQIGETPFLGTAPVCAKVQVGPRMMNVPIKLKANETIKWTYKESQDLRDERDGKIYKTVVVGEQTWMAENLDYKMNDSYCFDGNSYYCKKYGSLYTWWAATTACPAGWHLPSKDELGKLLETVGGKSIAGKMLKSKSGWKDDGDGSDDFSFTVLPAGLRMFTRYLDKSGRGRESFSNDAVQADFWSSTEHGSDSAYSIGMLCFSNNVSIYGNIIKDYGLSVRCIKDEIPAASSNRVPEVLKATFTDDRDGRTYKAVKIGSRWWMAENLNYEMKGSYCYKGKSANCKKYGRLYRSDAVYGACPSGWRLPSEGALLESVGYGETAGQKLKSKSGWKNNGNGSDDFSFAALPAGVRRGVKGENSGEGSWASFWYDNGTWLSIGENGEVYEDFCECGENDPACDADCYANARSVRCVKDLNYEKDIFY